MIKYLIMSAISYYIITTYIFPNKPKPSERPAQAPPPTPKQNGNGVGEYVEYEEVE